MRLCMARVRSAYEPVAPTTPPASPNTQAPVQFATGTKLKSAAKDQLRSGLRGDPPRGEQRVRGVAIRGYAADLSAIRPLGLYSMGADLDAYRYREMVQCDQGLWL